MTRGSSYKIVSIFSKYLARKARELAARMDGVKLIPQSDFPEGAPIHEDGSSVYDPAKPLVLFAIELSGREAVSAWDNIWREYDARRKEFA